MEVASEGAMGVRHTAGLEPAAVRRAGRAVPAIIARILPSVPAARNSILIAPNNRGQSLETFSGPCVKGYDLYFAGGFHHRKGRH